MAKIFRGFVAVLALALGFPALAGLGPNGLGPNGLGPNGLGPNGLGPNGLGPNGLGPNGLGPNGLGPNGLGPNGLGPNGLGPNGLDVNGLGPNGLGPNGLGPNGLPYTFFVVEPGYEIPRGERTSAFDTWFESDPAAASQYMRYFARCAYDGNTGVAYQDRKGRAWAWTGQYGFAMGSLMSPSLATLTLDPASPPVRSRMTVEEGKWVSACLLAHVNLQGSHQYISLRGNPPNPEAQQALALTTGELWTMSYSHGAFFGDLFSEAKSTARYACRQHSDAAAGMLLDTLIGRSCDAYSCYWTNPATNLSEEVIGNVTWCGREWIERTGEVMNPLYAASVFRFPVPGTLLSPLGPPEDYHPVFVNGIQTVELEHPPIPGWSSGRNYGVHDIPGCTPGPGILCEKLPGAVSGIGAAVSAGIITPSGSLPFDESQTTYCATDGACSYDKGGYFGWRQTGMKITGIRSGQRIEIPVRYTGQAAIANAGSLGPTPELPREPNLAEPFTALIRYSNCRTTPASASLTVSDAYGMGAPIGSEIWPSTIPDGATSCATGENFTWLQVYPVYGFVEDTGVAVAGRRPTLKVAIAGATQGESCTGAKILKGDGETGTCALKSVYFDWKRLKVMCRESGESKPVCRGDLVFDYRGGKWNWFCAYGGKAISACTGADAPDLDAVSFVPGKPWCAPEGATSFTGICK